VNPQSKFLNKFWKGGF